MKLKNKQTGEIGELCVDIERPDNGIRVYADDGIRYKMYNSLAELCKEWGDYKPKGFWIIESDGSIQYVTDDMLYNEYVDGNDFMACCERIGNKFETEEEAEKAVEKLRAWKRLEDKGFRFDGIAGNCIKYVIDVSKISSSKEKDELNEYARLIFGGEE